MSKPVESPVEHTAKRARTGEIVAAGVLLIVLIGVGVPVTKLALHMSSKINAAIADYDWFANAAIADYDWFANKHGEIKGAEVLELLAYGRLQRHQAEVKSRSGTFSISCKGDREAYRRLNQTYTDTTANRSDLIEEYNTAASHVRDKTIFGALPKHITFKHPFDEAHKE
jgi:hypothetical protein